MKKRKRKKKKAGERERERKEGEWWVWYRTGKKQVCEIGLGILGFHVSVVSEVWPAWDGRWIVFWDVMVADRGRRRICVLAYRVVREMKERLK